MSDNANPIEIRGFPGPDHDHGRCIANALSDAAQVCADRGARLTPLRGRVLELVWQSHRPLGAYDILEMLARDGRFAAPPTVYRALEFLLQNGLAHGIASLNAFVGCNRPGHPETGQFLICCGCGTAAELNDLRIARAVNESATEEGFAVQSHTIEVAGLCPDCQGQPTRAP